MPIYAFECKACGKRFEQLETVKLHDQHTERCPACGSTEIEHLIVDINVQTARKT